MTVVLFGHTMGSSDRWTWRCPMKATTLATVIDPALVDPAGPLSARDQAILAFERQWWRYAGAKEQAVAELFGISPTQDYQILNLLIDRPEALAHDPMLVKRLRRLRGARQRARSAGRLGLEA